MLRTTLVLLCAVAIAAVFLRADDAPPKAEGKPDAAAEANQPDPFAVPEGTASTVLQSYLRTLALTPPKEQTREGILDHLNKVDAAIAQIMGREVETELFLTAMQMRIEVINLLGRFGDEKAAEKEAALMTKLKQDVRPEVQRVVKRLELMKRIQKLPESEPEVQQQVIQELATMIQAVPAGDDEALQEAVQLAMVTGQVLEGLENPAVAISAYRLLAKYLAARSDERLTSIVERMEGIARRLDLPGKSITVEGTTLQGDKFDIGKWKGKVVLVDFWATWCGPCLAELPNVRRMYDAYHEKGFEIVGISLDEDPAELNKFLEAEKIPWVTLFDTNPENTGWENPIARYYGIGAIPTVILVDQQGKVVSLEARGPALAMHLEKLLGPPLEKKSDADGTGSAKLPDSK